MFILLGVYPNNYQLLTAQANGLVSYLQAGGNCYLEGADAWCYDPAGSIYRSYFGIAAVDDGSTMYGTIDGVAGTFTQGMSFAYAGENNYMDCIDPVSPAYTIFTNGGYNRSVAYNATTYKTIGSVFELGGLIDGALPSTKANLIEKNLTFFGILPGIAEYNKPAAALPKINVCPNPASNYLTLTTVLDKKTRLRIEIYNVLGQRLKCLIDELLDPGEYNLTWDLRDERNRELPPGTYFYRAIIDKETFTGKMLRIK
jgi:hypothetical protein